VLKTILQSKKLAISFFSSTYTTEVSSTTNFDTTLLTSF